ncbi:MAG: AzlD domain-containing protein [Gemmobacter sp.]|jgi:branched-subunit amino acid transport protein AzlD|nr:AzlD domain-containing protein [Gemmobacter sp.]
MRPEILLLALMVGVSTWAFRALPFRIDLSRLAPEGWLSRLLGATGPAAIAALLVASVLSALREPLAGQGPLGGGAVAVVAVWLWRRSVVLATLGGALAFGLLTLV